MSFAAGRETVVASFQAPLLDVASTHRQGFSGPKDASIQAGPAHPSLLGTSAIRCQQFLESSISTRDPRRTTSRHLATSQSICKVVEPMCNPASLASELWRLRMALKTHRMNVDGVVSMLAGHCTPWERP